MAFTGITATEAQIDQKSGANVSTDYTDEMKTQALLQAEAQVGTDTLFDWAANWATISATRRSLVTAITSATVAMEAIAFDMDAVGRSAANAMINRLDFTVIENIKSLLNKDKAEFVKGNSNPV